MTNYKQKYEELKEDMTAILGQILEECDLSQSDKLESIVENYYNKLLEHTDKDLCEEIYNNIYLKTFYDEHDNGQEPVTFDEFYNNEWQDDDCREWYVNINIQNK